MHLFDSFLLLSGWFLRSFSQPGRVRFHFRSLGHHEVGLLHRLVRVQVAPTLLCCFHSQWKVCYNNEYLFWMAQNVKLLWIKLSLNIASLLLCNCERIHQTLQVHYFAYAKIKKIRYSQNILKQNFLNPDLSKNSEKWYLQKFFTVFTKLSEQNLSTKT